MKLKKFRWGWCFLLVGLCSPVCLRRLITLRDGRHVQGKFAGGTQGVIAFSVEERRNTSMSAMF